MVGIFDAVLIKELLLCFEKKKKMIFYTSPANCGRNVDHFEKGHRQWPEKPLKGLRRRNKI